MRYGLYDIYCSAHYNQCSLIIRFFWLHGVVGADLRSDSVCHRLMRPPQALYSADGQTLTKTWAVGILGTERFEDSGPFLHWVVMAGGDIRERGLDLGLSRQVLDWLTGTADLHCVQSDFYCMCREKPWVEMLLNGNPAPINCMTSSCAIVAQSSMIILDTKRLNS
jgi:hypothetical protein